MTSEIEAWHFCADTLRDGRPIPPDGEWLVHDGDVIPCKSGLHASIRLIDALEYAPGSTLCRVILRGDIQHHGNDKIVGRERQIVWRIDATAVLREFARKCALDVIHLWSAPDVVRKYLETGDESLRAAARAAAWDAAWDAARGAAWAAAWAAARAAARAAQNTALEKAAFIASGRSL